MEQKSEETPATSPKCPRVRNKLQKSVSRQQSNSGRQRNPRTLDSVVTLVPRDLVDDDPASLTQPRPAPSPPSRNRQPASCARKEGHPYHYDRPLESPELLKPENYKAPVIPEFSQLVRRTLPPRPSPDPDFMIPTNPEMKRRTNKTPMSSIGQMEAAPRSRNTLHRTSSVELIAEQYNAVIESRYSPEYSDDSEPVLSPQATGDSASMVEPPDPSPISDDGTLVSFQGEAVYFKPLSCSPEPEPPSVPLSRQTSADDNVGLQISLDLLTHDLSSAIAGRPCRSSKGTAALQVWAMIEAYERLWERMSELSQSDPQAKAMQSMFDMWLQALYAVHSDMSKDAREEYASGDGE
ncbi:hypothetical protein B0I37DRAFT_383494 [Chaetomium sp. MPI-CAGE-AT-0009]|nr:hypothetical protein B0I37DRAFT_383494 [Chaetomium sp. MPI-CAGE-AT-0009]